MPRVLLPHTISDQLPTPDSTISHYHGQSMGTSWSVKLIDTNDSFTRHWQTHLQAVLDGVVVEMSHWDPSSDLGRFNLAPAGTWHTLPANFFKVLQAGLQVASDSDGAYNPAAGALVNLWGFGAQGRHDQAGFTLPSGQQISQAQLGCDWRAIKLDIATQRAFQPGGAVLDLSSIAKGFAVDALAQQIENQGVVHYLIEVGGELRGSGMKPDGNPWWVQLEQPVSPSNNETDQHVELEPVIIALHGLAVATSGDYLRYFDSGKQRCPHTIDPRSGRPISNGVASVSVIHRECMLADAISTALTVLGVDEGLRFANQHGIAARFVVRQNVIEHLKHQGAWLESCSQAWLAMSDEDDHEGMA